MRASNVFLTGLLITSALPLAVVWAGAPKVSAETIIVPTVPGSLDGAGGAGGVSRWATPMASEASTDCRQTPTRATPMPNNDALNSAAATGGNGGAGGNGVDDGNGGNGGSGGLATAKAATSIVSGPSEADAYSYGGNGGLGGGSGGNGGPGGSATATSAAANADDSPVAGNAIAVGGVGEPRETFTRPPTPARAATPTQAA